MILAVAVSVAARAPVAAPVAQAAVGTFWLNAA